ncbi:hypothetical protein GGX14DRAFT_408426 [Mycena pura]|uniref:Uncharacterized protein n=1 Tax=Mycena pura TaxID=153505 RepID=A0AAD6UL91_9AGAR|nr:hypothetical protein GGX14DRAFT_408426 [Mycena pura]
MPVEKEAIMENIVGGVRKIAVLSRRQQVHARQISPLRNLLSRGTARESKVARDGRGMERALAACTACAVGASDGTEASKIFAVAIAIARQRLLAERLRRRTSSRIFGNYFFKFNNRHLFSFRKSAGPTVIPKKNRKLRGNGGGHLRHSILRRNVINISDVLDSAFVRAARESDLGAIFADFVVRKFWADSSHAWLGKWEGANIALTSRSCGGRQQAQRQVNVGIGDDGADGYAPDDPSATSNINICPSALQILVALGRDAIGYPHTYFSCNNALEKSKEGAEQCLEATGGTSPVWSPTTPDISVQDFGEFSGVLSRRSEKSGKVAAYAWIKSANYTYTGIAENIMRRGLATEYNLMHYVASSSGTKHVGCAIGMSPLSDHAYVGQNCSRRRRLLAVCRDKHKCKRMATRSPLAKRDA